MLDAARFFQVLSDESRLKILWLLHHSPEICVCDLMHVLEIPQPKTSRHLATLRHAHLVLDRRQANWTYYSLRTNLGPLEGSILQTLFARLAEDPEAVRLLHQLEERITLREAAEAAARSLCKPEDDPVRTKARSRSLQKESR